MLDEKYPNYVLHLANECLAIIMKELASDMEDNWNEILAARPFSGTGDKIERTPDYLQYLNRRA